MAAGYEQDFLDWELLSPPSVVVQEKTFLYLCCRSALCHKLGLRHRAVIVIWTGVCSAGAFLFL